MKVRIYKPAKSTMQSGRGKIGSWVLEYEITSKRQPEPLMGWVSSADTLNQVELSFDTAEKAIEFAEEKGWSYTVAKESVRKVKPRNYVDNFVYRGPAPGEKTGAKKKPATKKKAASKKTTSKKKS